MPAKPPIKAIPIKEVSKEMTEVDLEYKRAETKEKCAAANLSDAEVTIKKLEVLERILSSSVVIQGQGYDSVVYKQTIEHDWDKKVITDKIIELVKKL
jgi:hypothetical protein